MSELTLREQIHAALVELGNTADRIAEKLFALGVRGKRGEECACPLFHYLAERFPGRIDAVGQSVAYLIEGAGYSDVDLPKVVREFVTSFDSGSYDELVVE